MQLILVLIFEILFQKTLKRHAKNLPYFTQKQTILRNITPFLQSVNWAKTCITA